MRVSYPFCEGGSKWIDIDMAAYVDKNLFRMVSKNIHSDWFRIDDDVLQVDRSRIIKLNFVWVNDWVEYKVRATLDNGVKVFVVL